LNDKSAARDDYERSVRPYERLGRDDFLVERDRFHSDHATTDATTADRFLGKTALMQSVRPDNTDPIPLRQSTHGIGTIMLRFVGLLIAATVVMALIWSR
jgi:hypothetical protein